jgi:uncharacterized metal-binding protein YceD (DUF177 family)
MTRKPFVLPFTHALPLATLAGPQHLKLRPDEQELRAIARLGKLHAVNRFLADVAITPRADGTIRIHGTLDAAIEPLCVVTLEPFAQTISEEIEAVFADANVIEKLRRRAEEAELDFDPPDEIEDNVIDIGALAVEFLMLALDPYPKKPGVSFGDHVEPVESASPFAALKALRPDEKS